jgi:hypothetical protein
MGVDNIGRDLGNAMLMALLIAFLAGAGCVGGAFAAYKYFPWRVTIEGR